MIKTKLQVGQVPLHFNKYHPLVPDGGMINCALHIYRNEGGFYGFWRGFSACVPRAIFANAFMFVAYDYAQKYFATSKWGEDREMTWLGFDIFK